MKISVGTFALSFAVMAVLFAPAGTVQAQGSGQTICRDVSVPGRVGAIDRNEKAHTERVCNTVSYPAPPLPGPAPEPPKVEHTTGSSETVYYNATAEARKAQPRTTYHPTPASSGLCPPPYRMTAQDGCQR